MEENRSNAAQVAAQLLPRAREFVVGTVAAALEELARCALEQRWALTFGRADVAREIMEMNMDQSLREQVVAALPGRDFLCEWRLPAFAYGAAGFMLH